jgi:hypothetical protein
MGALRVARHSANRDSMDSWTVFLAIIGMTASLHRCPWFESSAMAQASKLSQHATGLIVDEDKKPLAGVELMPSMVDASLSNEERLRKISTDENGVWTWDVGLHPKVYALKTKKPGYLTAQVSLEPNTHRCVVLTIGNSIQGFVVDEQDRVVEGAVVSFVEKGADYTSEPTWTTQSDNRGWFELLSVSSPDVHLRATLPTGETGYLDNVSLSESNVPIIAMKKPAALEIEVVDDKNQAIADATIQLVAWCKTSLIPWHGRTDRLGKANWDRAPVGPSTFKVQKFGYYEAWSQADIQGPHRLKVVLLRMDNVDSNVLDDESGNPIDRFVAISSRENATGSSGRTHEVFGSHAATPLPRDALIGTDGVLPLSSIPFHDFIDVELVAIGYERFKFRLDRRTDVGSFRKFRLKRANRAANVQCRVVRTTGQPVAGAKVLFAAQGGVTIASQSDPLSIQWQWPYHVHQQTTDSHGSFGLLSNSAFEFVAAWNEEGSYLGLSKSLQEGASIELQPYGTLSVRLPSTMPGTFVQFAVQQTIELQADKNFSRAHVYTPLDLAAEDGLFICNKVPAGWIAIVQQSINPIFKQVESRILGTMRVAPGAKYELNFVGSSGLRGVLDFRNKSLADRMSAECILTLATLDNSSHRIFRRPVQPDGKIAFDELPAGRYSLSIATQSRDVDGVATGQPPMQLSIGDSTTILLENELMSDIGTIVVDVVE